MSGFEFVFSLFGLLLGLALAEGLGGLSRSIKSRHHVKIGWPTVLLAIFVSCDVITFWMYGWAMRERLPISWPVLFGGFVITGTYYIASSLIFPTDLEGRDDLNSHFDEHRRTVLAGILFCNIALLTVTYVLGLISGLDIRMAVITWSFFPVIILAIVTPDRRVVLACLVWLIALYPLSILWQ